jgi:cytochrome c-type biogenesis protein CcmE
MLGEEFHASKILMKCPSKYTTDEVEVTEVTATSAKI